MSKMSVVAAALLLICAATAQGAAPLIYYNFETGVTNQGTGGAIYNATTTGSPTAGWTGGTVGSSTRPGGVSGAALSTVHTPNNYLTMPAGTAALGQTFTISGWFYLSPSSATASQRYYPFEASNNFDVSFGTQASPTTTGVYSSYVAEVGPQNVTLATDAWHHVAHAFSSNGTTTTRNVYINGVLTSTATAATSLMNFSVINIANNRGGDPSLPAAPTRNWDGLLDEFAVWNSALSAAEVTQVALNGVYGLSVNGAGSARVSLADGTPDADAAVSIAGARWSVGSAASVTGVNNDLKDAGFSDQPFFRTVGGVLDGGVLQESTLTLTYNGLDEHTHVNLGMLLAQLDSADPIRDGDRFLVRVDGETILDAGFGYGVSTNGSFTDVIVTTGNAALDAELLALRTIAGTNLYGDTIFLDNVYDLANLSLFDMIPHTGDTLTLELIGRVNQTDGEWYGVDNITLELVNTPEPASLTAFGMVLAVVGGAYALRRRRAVR